MSSQPSTSSTLVYMTTLWPDHGRVHFREREGLRRDMKKKEGGREGEGSHERMEGVRVL